MIMNGALRPDPPGEIRGGFSISSHKDSDMDNDALKGSGYVGRLAEFTLVVAAA